MNMRRLRKALGLFIVDIVIIIGIFVLQFRTDSNIIEKLGNLQVTLTKSDSENDEFILKNYLKASYNGFNLYFDDQTPAKVLLKGEEEKKNIHLLSYNKDDSTFRFEFTEGVAFNISLSDDSSEAPLTVRAEVPQTVQNFYLPYGFAYNMKIQKDEGKKVVLNDKKLNWSFSTDEVNDGYIVFSAKETLANYSIFDDTKKFTLDSLTELAQAEGINYLTVTTNFKNNLISAFKATLSDNNFSEQAVVSYVAAMSEAGKYQQAVDDIPQSYKRSEQRTYLSAPYFNNLVNMNTILEQQLKTDSNLISKAVYSDSLDIFTTHNLAAHLCIHDKKDEVTKILEKAASADILNCAIAQITGIMQTFNDLCSMNTEYAKILRPVMDACIEKLTSACKFENNVLTISENDTFLSVIQGVETGIALLRYGEISGNEIYTKAGRVIVSSYISESSSFDLRTLANLYPLIAYDNWYYPHFNIIHAEKNKSIWAWTCAQEIKYLKDDEGSILLSVVFPQGLTHYIIFKEIPEFNSIYMYNMAFRTDPRFETYNSSGYVYKTATNTLLIKSRHKSETEDIKLVYKAPAPQKPAASTTQKQTQPAATTQTTPTTSNTETKSTETTKTNATTSAETSEAKTDNTSENTTEKTN